VTTQPKSPATSSTSGVNGHWDLVQRIANSEQFTKSPKVRDFLLYVCRALLEERVGDINEQRIGERVFGRAENYNPSEDNIVRSQARILRQKLETYFASEGAHEPFVLQIRSRQFHSRAFRCLPPPESAGSTTRT
jgi:hypothetical protein